jgi:hypothetical protein
LARRAKRRTQARAFLRNTSTYPPQEKNKSGEIHHDMGMIGYDKAREKFVLRQFQQKGS